jgi:hypothetical protein
VNSSILNSPLSSPQSGLAAVHAGRLTRLDRAKWELAVLDELAQPGHMALAAVFDGTGQVVDFTWQEASPTATRALGCAGEDLVGRALKQVLVACAMDASVFDSYRTVFLQQRAETLRVDGQDGVALHAISPLPNGLSVEVTCIAAMDRVLAAQQAVREAE